MLCDIADWFMNGTSRDLVESVGDCAMAIQ
jgi:hypothetical protein